MNCYSLIKPLLFQLDAELTHDLTLKTLKFAEKSSVLNLYPQAPTCAPREVMGLTFANAIGLAAVKDLHTCEIVGWAMGERMTKSLICDALRAAYWRKKPTAGLLHHSDRGSQYCAKVYRALQTCYKMQTSMSRKGNCWELAFSRHLHVV